MHFFLTLLALATYFCLSLSQDLNYEYIVVGSGAGGGPLAARLALAGHKTLLIEAGDDNGDSYNYSVPGYQAKSTEDPAMAWDFFVRHYADDDRQKLDYKLTYDTPDGGEYTGLNPPADSTIKGVLYPRSATLGGCTAHNALVAIYPDRDDFQNLADLTGDASWDPDNMRKYFVKMENLNYTVPSTSGHGFDGWLGITEAPVALAFEDSQLINMISGGVTALSTVTNNSDITISSLLTADPNANNATRDSNSNIYQVPISAKNHKRNGSREFILSVANAKDASGNKLYPLDLRMNCYVTKVTFDKSSPPRATGVEFLDGKYLYRASKRSATAGPGKPGAAKACREVIVAGGAYNSPQILKLSGIGPAAELESFGIPVVKDLPGVGTNLQDHYEVVVQGTTPKNFSVLNGCTFGFYGQPDPCLDAWLDPNQTAASYDSSGFAATMFYKSSTSPDGNYDEFIFGGPVNFRGYYPGYSVDATNEHNWWSWAMLKSHPRNRAGSVTLRSADPLDTPEILYNYFDTGDAGYEADLETIYESIELARQAFNDSGLVWNEVLPGANATTKAQIEAYIKNTAWGHHCSSTCPIGTDDDLMAVLDSSFRVRGVRGLRVVDASVYPRIPGTFTAVSTYLVGEKAADVILTQLAASGGSLNGTCGSNSTVPSHNTTSSARPPQSSGISGTGTAPSLNSTTTKVIPPYSSAGTGTAVPPKSTGTGTAVPPKSTGTGTAVPPKSSGSAGVVIPPASTGGYSYGNSPGTPGVPGSSIPPKSSAGTGTAVPPKSSAGTGTAVPPKSSAGTGTAVPPKSSAGTGTAVPPKSTAGTGTTVPPKSTAGTGTAVPPKSSAGTGTAVPPKSSGASGTAVPPKSSAGTVVPPKSTAGTGTLLPPKSTGATGTAIPPKSSFVTSKSVTPKSSSSAAFPPSYTFSWSFPYFGGL